MDYLQYLIIVSYLLSNKVYVIVLNLIINGLPSIPDSKLSVSPLSLASF